ncbi:MAG: FG-GAP repeat domain-containing protein, partial [Planctomycetota bacterium]
MLIRTVTVLGVTALVAPVHAGGEWVDYVDETDTRLVASGALGANDTEEKDYAWGDLDNDGWIDLVNVRKQEFTTTGKRANVLFMNELGTLVDRTVEYASDSDVGGDAGFLTPTNDRDVVIVDVNNDGWLDVVTATTLTDNQAKHLSHPRVYMNLGEISGVWQGLRHEDARIPQMHATAGPRFCSVAAGDLTGDGFADLYFGDYDSGGSQIFDYNNRVLVNDGTGFFTDLTTSVLPTFQMRESAFGAASVIIDMNNDGVLDVVKQTSLSPPQHIALNYNNPADEGVFNVYDIVYTQAAYFVSTGDLNNDGLLDLIITDDNDDRYMLSQGGSQPNFTSLPLQLESG